MAFNSNMSINRPGRISSEMLEMQSVESSCTSERRILMGPDDGTGHNPRDLASIFMAEFFGTAMLLFLGCMCCVTGFGNEPSNVSSGLGFGFTVMMVIITFGCVSGAHINPSVSIAAFIYNLINFPMLILYLIAQFLGAICGYGLLMGITPAKIFSDALYSGHGSCVTAPHGDLSTLEAFAVEFLVTGILIWTCCGIWDPRNGKNLDSNPIKFALIVGGISIAAGPYTGASMNPARTLAPAIWNGSFFQVWIYFLAPPLAGIVMPLIYKYGFRRELHEEEQPIKIVTAQEHVKTDLFEQHRLSASAKMKQSTLDTISVLLAELIGTALLVMLGCMGCVGGLGHKPSHFEMCINFGLVVMIIVQVFGCVSGSHLNPAVTATAWVYEMVSTKMALGYAAVQCIGAFMGFGLLKIVTPAAVFSDALEAGAGFCVTSPNPKISTLQAVGIEFVATSVLALVCCGVWDPRNAKYHDSVALKFGFTIGCLAVTAGPYTGASMNPARSLGPVLWNGDWTAHWVYWVGPLLGAFVSAFAYKIVFRREVFQPPASPSELTALNTEK
ncbi:uncharacterized protein LOC129766195 [Toxorhynchites rutilus septentrionalis]|uniref:uncharacterized protein LOC129766195 n=1 Tax=Toxorhynchites rutilus septentrionalis TaxID=329112 RepID=UPI002479BC81|nr:uncharacterized protein LOC129766195 [Toxorhynchites rutilus septentrionalis]